MHEDYSDISEYFHNLDKMYPIAELQAVRLYDKYGDKSLGYTIDRTIYLNAAWFTKPKLLLEGAAARGMRYDFPGVPKWHGMMREPHHMWAHEFAHVIETAFDIDADFAMFKREGFQQARRHPDFAPTGYSQANESEWWAESFAAAHLGLEAPQLDTVREYIDTKL